MDYSCVVLIAALNPDNKLLTLLKQLGETGFTNIVLVNDGSDSIYDKIFDSAVCLGCTLLKHSVNLGKGRALKTGFNYILQYFANDSTITVCADADGQHAVVDIKRCFERAKETPLHLVMGCRQFDSKQIPLRSRFGNKITRNVFSILCGVSVSDTQTGLRAMSCDLMRRFMTVGGERFEYEMNMLIETKALSIPIEEVPIETIYIEENKTSHFNPLKDSLRIYKVFAKFLFSSLLAFGIDIGTFSLLVYLLDGVGNVALNISVSTAIARILSSIVNYLVNRNTVFNAKSTAQYTIFKYYTLCILQASVSALCVNWLFSWLHLNKVLIKLTVDSLLFFVGFKIQREWVFKIKSKVRK